MESDIYESELNLLGKRDVCLILAIALLLVYDYPVGQVVENDILLLHQAGDLVLLQETYFGAPDIGVELKHEKQDHESKGGQV